MARSSKSHPVLLLVVIVALAYYFRAQLLSAVQSVSPSLAAAIAPVFGSTAVAPSTPSAIAPGASTLLHSVFGGGTTQPSFNGNLFSGPLGSTNMGLGFFPGGGNIGSDGENDSSTSPAAGPVNNGFGNCSANPRDGKMLCSPKAGIL